MQTRQLTHRGDPKAVSELLDPELQQVLDSGLGTLPDCTQVSAEKKRESECIAELETQHSLNKEEL